MIQLPRMSHGVAVALALLAFTGEALRAQSYADELRLPPRARPFLAAYLGAGGPAGTGGALGGGIYRDIFNPATQALGVQLEGYAFGRPGHGGVQGAFDLGLRSPILRLGSGVEIDVPHGQAGPFLSVTHPIRRGGILLPGGMLHATWVFGGAQRLRVGYELPIFQPLVGEDRPGSDRVHLARGRMLAAAPAPDAGLRQSAEDLRAWTLRASAAVVPFLGRPGSATPEREIRDSLAALAAGGGADAVLARYHAALDLAFSRALEAGAAATASTAAAGSAAPTPAGRALADSVRALLLARVLLPYDALLGQKRDPETLAPFADSALRAFAARPARARWLLGRLLSALDEVVAGQRARWGDARLVWLPLQLGLRAEQHRSQPQIDSLIERATGGSFSDSNHVAYARDAQFQWELYRSIHDAQRYHVLWIHDFKGVNDSGAPDAVAFRQVVYGYLDALIRRVRAYDAERLLPEYHIIFDQFYFEQNRSRLWMPLLLDPLGGHIRLRGVGPDWQARVDSMQAQLRQAVAGSKLLQEEARRRGAGWLHDRVAVHVHVTQQADPTFWSRDIVPLVGLPDNGLRDHRKLVFYDLTEGDPYRGMMIATGMGVGEQFASPDWEDRAMLLRGPAALAVKRAAATELERQGLKPKDLPAFLRPSTDTVAAAERAPIPRFDLTPATAIQLHNQVGYGEKQATVAKAVLYTLLPSGSVLKIPDSLWNNELWSSLLVGAALRGGRVLVMAPSVANAPAPGGMVMALAEQALSRIILAQHALAPSIAAAAGLLRVGIYDTRIPVEDIPARIDSALATRAHTPWLRQLEPYAPAVEDSLRAVAAELRAAGLRQPATPTSHQAGEHPKLHMKAQFFASAEGWDDLFRDPAWGRVLAEYFRGHARLAQQQSSYVELRPQPEPADQHASGGGLFQQQVTAQRSDNAVYYLLLGSHNEDYRSALLDGEDLLVLAHFGAAIGIEDFTLLPGLCIWVDSLDDLHRYLPARRGKVMALARRMRILF